MFCTSCGNEIPESVSFCPNCGAEVSASAVKEGLPEGIIPSQDGALHWIYQLDMKKNRAIIQLTEKILVGISAGIAAFLFILGVIEGDFGLAIKEFLIVGIGMSVLMIVLAEIAWFIMGLVRKGVYVYEYRMTEEGITSNVTEEEQRRAETMTAASFLLASVTKNPGLIGSGLAASRNMVESRFQDVKSIRADRTHDSIRVNSTMLHNVVFCEPHQFDFVYEYLVSHCPNANRKD